VAALVVPMAWVPNASDGGDKVTGAVPVPLNCVVCGELGALSVMVSVPAREPRAVGVKVTEIAQVVFDPNVLGDNGQVDVCAKLPVLEMPVIVRGTVWLFLRVTVFAALVVLITWVPKERLALVKLTASAPVPVNCAVCGELEALSLTVSVPEREPVALGVKVTEIVQLVLAASVAGEIGHVEVCAKFPETEIPLIVRGVVWVLVRTKLSAVLVVWMTQVPKAKLEGFRV
jgi:hypothetical protein